MHEWRFWVTLTSAWKNDDSLSVCICMKAYAAPRAQGDVFFSLPYAGQLRMLCKLYLTAQWRTNGYGRPHVAIITIWLYTFPRPHTCFSVLNRRRGPGGVREDAVFSLIRHHSTSSSPCQESACPPGAVGTRVNADVYISTLFLNTPAACSPTIIVTCY